MTSILTTYSISENGVTASILATLKSLPLSRIERLLVAIFKQSKFKLVRFQNQPSRGGAGVPDAIIYASIRLLGETKAGRGGVRVPDNSFSTTPENCRTLKFDTQGFGRE